MLQKDNYQLRSIIDDVMRLYFPSAIKKGNDWTFRCNVCGDSKKNKHKKRGHIYFKSDSWFYYCFNCGYSHRVETWLKKYFHSSYNHYIKSLISTPEIQKREYEAKEKNPNTVESKNIGDEKYFIKITSTKDIPILKDAISFCESRKIPKEIWEKFYVSVDGKYKNRLIIPFYKKNGKIEYYQGRTLVGEEPKYKSMVGEKKIYNFDFVDQSKPIIALEGPIDSMFVENSIAIIGVSSSIGQDEILNKLDIRYLMDCDVTGKKISINLIKQGKYVFNWKKFIRDHNLPEKKKWDINEYILHTNLENKLKFENIKKYFTKDLYDIIWFK